MGTAMPSAVPSLDVGYLIRRECVGSAVACNLCVEHTLVRNDESVGAETVVFGRV